MALRQLRQRMSSRSVLLATFVVHTAGKSARPKHAADTEHGWVYPACTSFERTRLAALIARQGLREVELGWPHISQKWYALCRQGSASCGHVKEALPTLQRDPWLMMALLGEEETQ